MLHALIRYRDVVFCSIAAFGLLGLGLDALAPTARSATARLEFAAGAEPLVFGTYHTEGARVHIDRVPGTRQVALRVEHPVPEVALMVANRVVRDYVEGRAPRQSNVSPRQRRLVTRLATLQTQSQANEKEQASVASRLGVLTDFLRERTPEWRSFSSAPGRLSERRLEIMRAEDELASARKVYRPKHPRLVRLERRVLELNALAWSDLQRVLVTENVRRRQLADREIALRASMVKVEQSLNGPRTERAPDRATAEPRATVVSEPSVTPWTFQRSGVFSLLVYLTAGLLAGASVAVALDSHRDLTEALAGGEA
jgi:hypothetical protein